MQNYEKCNAQREMQSVSERGAGDDIGDDIGDAGRRGRAIRPVNTERAEARRHGDCFSKLTRLGEGATSSARRAHGDDIGDDIGDAGRRGRRPLPTCTMHTMHTMSARTMASMVGRDVPGAPRPRERHRERHRGRGPPGTSAPTIMHNTHHAHAMPAPMHTHHGIHGRARRPRRAAPTGTTSGTPRVRGPPGTSAPTNKHNVRHARTPCPHAPWHPW